MKRLAYIGGGIICILAVAAVTILAAHSSPEEPVAIQDVSVKQAKAVAADTKPCATSNSSLRISAKDRSDIEQSLVLHIIDVPAGTNVDINIASYSNGQATGSAIYPKDYGTYNFTVDNKQDTNVQGRPWRITSYKPCTVKNS